MNKLGLLILSFAATVIVPSRAAAQPSARADVTSAGAVVGTVHFQEAPGTNYVQIVGEISGLAPGSTHAVRLNEATTCAALAGTLDLGPRADTSAANHPFQSGVLPNITAGTNGKAKINQTTSRVRLAGPQSAIGVTVVIHASADTFVAGGGAVAGVVIGCGVLVDTTPPFTHPLFANGTGYSCPTGNTSFVYSPPLDPASPAQALAACEACYGVGACFQESADCAGLGFGPNPPGEFQCGTAYFGFQNGCSGDDGRSWAVCNSYETYGYWGKF